MQLLLEKNTLCKVGKFVDPICIENRYSVSLEARLLGVGFGTGPNAVV